MTGRIVVFRFDRNPLVCRSRVRALRSLNPGVPVAGLYGGAPGLRRMLFRLASRKLIGLDSFYVSRHEARWNWQHGDLALAAWFRDVGSQLAFDVVHLVEWDLLLAAPLAEVYRAVPADAVGLTAVTPLADIGADWPWADQAAELLRVLGERWALDGQALGCLGVGPCFPRAFLSSYAALDVPEIGNDEVRLPQFARILGFSVADTGLRRAWHSSTEDLVFNATGQDVAESTILAELGRPDGRRAFHPVRRPLRVTG